MKPLDLMDVLDDLPEELIAQELAPPKANRIVKLYRFSAVAACLVLTLGLVQFAWDRPQKIPTAPPAAETTTSTETTVLMDSTPSAVTTDSPTETQEIPTS
ncbi:MAG: hypothetical protein II916_05725, partial [Oscillospiraceae bacterium]|nr:hypothetical protein [Oscillospiraceae bacterium]